MRAGLGLVIVLVAACGKIGFDPHATPDAPPDLTLRVTVETDRMAGPPTIASVAELDPGTVGLSLREALAIAANREGPDLVVFEHAGMFTVGSELVVGGDGTTVDGSAGATIAPDPAYTGLLVHVTGTNATVKSVSLAGAASEGVRVEATSQVMIDGGRIAIAGAIPVHVLASTDVTVQNTFVALQAKTGTVFGIVLEGSSRAHVVNNIVDPGTAWMIHVQDTSDSEVRGNILDGADTGITVFGTSARNTIFMNVSIAPVFHAVYIDTAPTANVVMNNTSLSAAGGAYVDVGTGTGNMFANNLDSMSAADFVNAAAYDFHLAVGSTSVDAAMDLGQDMLPDAPERFLGAAPDLGAVETR